MDHIDALKFQPEEAEIELQHLREEEAVILDSLTSQRQVLAPFRKLPKDILREICAACVTGQAPELTYGRIPTPYILSQLCSKMRQIALAYPTHLGLYHGQYWDAVFIWNT